MQTSTTRAVCPARRTAGRVPGAACAASAERRSARGRARARVALSRVRVSRTRRCADMAGEERRTAAKRRSPALRGALAPRGPHRRSRSRSAGLCGGDDLRACSGIELFDTQLFAAAVLLEGQLAEMATGEGKTLAAAAAAAVAGARGRAGSRDHGQRLSRRAAMRRRSPAVLRGARTQRRHDHAGQLAATRAARPTPATSSIAPRASSSSIICATGLRSAPRRSRRSRAAPLALTGAARAEPLLRGLCMAIVDEADSVLIDEATVPLVLSEAPPTRPAQRADLWQALAIARQLAPGERFPCWTYHARRVDMTPRGEERRAVLAASLGETWRSRRRRNELLTTALAALNAYRTGSRLSSFATADRDHRRRDRADRAGTRVVARSARPDRAEGRLPRRVTRRAPSRRSRTSVFSRVICASAA